MKFSKESFAELGLPDLLLNVWEYSNYLTELILNQHCEWCVELAKEQWQPSFKNFQFVINNLRKRNKQFYNFGRISSADKSIL